MRFPKIFLGLLPAVLAAPLISENVLDLVTLSQRQLGSTENDLVDGKACADMTIIFARGTTEAGNVGTLVGPPFFQAVRQQMGSATLAVQGVDYAADVPGFLAGGDANGSMLMAQLVGQAMSKCPNTKIVMAGYSQGGQLVHNAATMLSSTESKAVNSAVIFGDPDNGKPVGNISAGQTKVICHQGDLICDGQPVIHTPHLTYSQNADEAAQFVVQNAGLWLAGASGNMMIDGVKMNVDEGFIGKDRMVEDQGIIGEQKG